MSTASFGPLAVWRSGLASGIRMARTAPILGLKRILLPVSYWRAVEFGFAFRSLQRLPRSAKVLDVGSPKDLALACARRFGFEMTSTDILQAEVDISARSATAQRIAGRGPGLVHSEVQDARALTYDDASFDAAFSISVLEHIPDTGDTKAMRELIRVVRPGGRIVVTVPYGRSHEDVFVDRPVYERDQVENQPVFFERHYDAVTLMSRLIDHTGVWLEVVEHWGEGFFRVERLLGRLGRLRDPLSPLEGPLAALSLRQIGRRTGEHPMAAFFVLTRA